MATATLQKRRQRLLQYQIEISLLEGTTLFDLAVMAPITASIYYTAVNFCPDDGFSIFRGTGKYTPKLEEPLSVWWKWMEDVKTPS